ncbi:hypothetical protein NQZ68_042082 [Dissostichus eleginoides]|nr:hypothetical protein NQZ68_042082 [Dissostichus eleginoides]
MCLALVSPRFSSMSLDPLPPGLLLRSPGSLFSPAGSEERGSAFAPYSSSSSSSSGPGFCSRFFTYYIEGAQTVMSRGSARETPAAGFQSSETLCVHGARAAAERRRGPGYDPYSGPPCSVDLLPLGVPGPFRRSSSRDATSSLKAWLTEHRRNPYPTRGEKVLLAILTSMTLTQVSTWFANARRRMKKERKTSWMKTPQRSEDEEEEEEEEEHLEKRNQEPIREQHQEESGRAGGEFDEEEFDEEEFNEEEFNEEEFDEAEFNEEEFNEEEFNEEEFDEEESVSCRWSGPLQPTVSCRWSGPLQPTVSCRWSGPLQAPCVLSWSGPLQPTVSCLWSGPLQAPCVLSLVRPTPTHRVLSCFRFYFEILFPLCLVFLPVSGLPSCVWSSFLCLVFLPVSGLPSCVWSSFLCLVFLPVSRLPSCVWSSFLCLVFFPVSGLPSCVSSSFLCLVFLPVSGLLSCVWSSFLCLVFLPVSRLPSCVWSSFLCLVFLPVSGLPSCVSSSFLCLVFLPVSGLPSCVSSSFLCLVFLPVSERLFVFDEEEFKTSRLAASVGSLFVLVFREDSKVVQDEGQGPPGVREEDQGPQSAPKPKLWSLAEMATSADTRRERWNTCTTPETPYLPKHLYYTLDPLPAQTPVLHLGPPTCPDTCTTPETPYLPKHLYYT